MQVDPIEKKPLNHFLHPALREKDLFFFAPRDEVRH